jgi:hypothetical protein
MRSTHYCAAWTEFGCFISCGHSHGSVSEAVACVRIAGAYVVAVDAGTMRALSSREEAEFRFAPYNHPAGNAVIETPAIAVPMRIDSGYAVMTRIRVGRKCTWTTWMCFATYEEAAAHAREVDTVVRLRSAEWQALRRKAAVVSPSHACADTAITQEITDETVIEFVFRVLAENGIEQNGAVRQKAKLESINSEASQDEKPQQRKRA